MKVNSLCRWGSEANEAVVRGLPPLARCSRDSPGVHLSFASVPPSKSAKILLLMRLLPGMPVARAATVGVFAGVLEVRSG